MTTWIHVNKQEIETATDFILEYEITNSHGIEKELFVLSLDGSFNHVATPSDINTYPINAALAKDLGFYRSNKTSITKATKSLIIAQESDIKKRLNLVVTTWSNLEKNTHFGGIDSFTIESE